MKKISFALYAAMSLGQPAAGLELKGGESYFCTAKFSGGITFDVTTKKWRSTTFNVDDDNFVLQLFREGTRTEKLGEKDHPFVDVRVFITKSGSNWPVGCSGATETRLDENGFFSCSTGLTEYRFNMKYNRFLAAYMIGYINGLDAKSDTPAITGGVCTKIP